MTAPQTCRLRRDPEGPLAAHVKEMFDLVETIDKTSRIGRYAVRCRDCRQRSIHDFHEKTDRTSGNGSIRTARAPVAVAGMQTWRKVTPSAALHRIRAGLVRNGPTNAERHAQTSTNAPHHHGRVS